MVIATVSFDLHQPAPAFVTTHGQQHKQTVLPSFRLYTISSAHIGTLQPAPACPHIMGRATTQKQHKKKKPS